MADQCHIMEAQVHACVVHSGSLSHADVYGSATALVHHGPDIRRLPNWPGQTKLVLHQPVFPNIFLFIQATYAGGFPLTVAIKSWTKP